MNIIRTDSNKIIGRKLTPEDVKHGDIIKFSKTSPYDVKVETTGVVQHIIWSSRTGSYQFFTEDFRPNNFDNNDHLLGIGTDDMYYMGHQPSPLDSAVVGDSFFSTEASREIPEGTFTKHEDGWWIGRHKNPGDVETLTIHPENIVRMLFRRSTKAVLESKKLS